MNGNGYVGTSPGTLTVQVPYGDQVQLMGQRGLGMIDPTKYWNYGRDDGRSALAVQPMFSIGPSGRVTGLSGPGVTPTLLGQPANLTLLGRQLGSGTRLAQPNLQLLGRRGGAPDITLTGGRVMIPRPTLLGDPTDNKETQTPLARQRRVFFTTAALMFGGVALGVAVGALVQRRRKLGVMIGAGVGAAVGAGAAALVRNEIFQDQA